MEMESVLAAMPQASLADEIVATLAAVMLSHVVFMLSLTFSRL